MKQVASVVRVLAIWAIVQFMAGWVFRKQRWQYAGSRRHFLVTQGGVQLRPTGDEVSDAVASVLMGGMLLDLREAQLTQRPARIDVLSVMGGVEVLVPEDWKVQIDVQPTMGGVQDRRTGSIDPARPVDLVLSGRVVMSGLDVGTELPRKGFGRWRG